MEVARECRSVLLWDMMSFAAASCSAVIAVLLIAGVVLQPSFSSSSWKAFCPHSSAPEADPASRQFVLAGLVVAEHHLCKPARYRSNDSALDPKMQSLHHRLGGLDWLPSREDFLPVS